MAQRNPWEMSDDEIAAATAPQGQAAPPTIRTRPASPTLPYETEIARNRAGASVYDAEIARANAQRAAAEAAQAQAQLQAGGGTAEQRQAVTDRRAQAEAATRAQITAEQNFNGYVRGGWPWWLGGILPTAENSAFNRSAQQLYDAVMPITRTPGQGSQDQREFAAAQEARLASSRQSDLENRQVFDYTRSRIDAARRAVGLPAMDWDRAISPQPPAQDRTQSYSMQNGADQMELTGAAPRLVNDPALAGVNARVDRMLRSGRPDAEIRGYLQSMGIQSNGLDRVLEFRRQNPGYRGSYSPDLERGAWEQPTALQRGVAAVPEAAGAYAANAGNALTAGWLAELAPGDSNINDALIRGVSARNPGSAIAGNLTGGALLGAGAGAASPFLRLPSLLTRGGAFAPAAIGGDVAYGAAYGAGENPGDRLSGAITGASVAGLTGVPARGMFGAAGGAIAPTGGRSAPLYDAGITPTIGQRFRGSVAGDALNLVEEASQSVPLLGRITRNARQGARDQWRDAIWNDTLGEIGQRLPPGTGPTEAHQFARQAFDDAYDSARSGLTFTPDGDWANSFGGIQRQRGRLTADDQRRFDSLFEDAIGRRLRNGGGSLSGDEFKMAASDIGRAIRETNPQNTELLGVYRELDDALHAGASRQSPPEAVAALNAADRGYAKLATVQNASRRRLGNADADPADFGPSDILQANRNEGVRGSRFLRGETPFYREAQAGRMLEDVLPNSGTVDRLGATGQTLLGAGAATGFIPWPVVGAATAPILVNSPGVRQAIARFLTPRSSGKLNAAGSAIRRIAPYGGMFGAPLTLPLYASE